MTAGGEGKGASKGFYFTIVFGMLVCGTLNTICFKEQDDYIVNPADPRPFYHPFIQTFVMFIAEATCLVAFYIAYAVSPKFKAEHDNEEQEAIQEGLQTENVWWKAAFPALCDISGTGLQLVAMNFMDQSVFVMLRGGSPVIIAMLTVIFLKRVLVKAQILGLGLVVLGVTVVGVNTFIHADHTTSPNLVAGVICCFLSMFGSGIQAIVEEKILRRNHIHPLKLVGFEGIFGLLFNVVVLVIASYVPCDVNNVQACNANGYVEDVWSAVNGIFSHTALFVWVFVSMVSLGLTNFFAMTVTKVASALTRAVLAITVLVLVWVYSLLFMGAQWFWLQFGGFLTLVIGNLVYQKIIKIPGLDSVAVKGSIKGSKAIKSFGHGGPDPVPHLLVEEDAEQTDESGLLNTTQNNF